MASNAHAQDVDNGQRLYQSQCAGCHSRDLTGGYGPNLIDDTWLHGSTRGGIREVITQGVPGTGMPSFKHTLNEEQVNHIIDYLIHMRTSSSTSHIPSLQSPIETLDYAIKVEEFVSGLEIPWALEFTDTHTALITERAGRLRIVERGRLREQPIADTPTVYHPPQAQGGLLDIVLHPDFNNNGWVYLAYTEALEKNANEEHPPSMLRIVRGKIRNYRWVEQEDIFVAPQKTYTTTPPYHYGSRMVFDEHGYLFFSVGDRYAQDQAQDLQRPNGKIHRVHDDGKIPVDNPFVKRANALASIYSYGHRHPQGMAIHPQTGEIWAAEHGPKGGDELNRLVAGGNYGWPIISYGINYDGSVLTPHRQQQGMQQPVRYWRPSIATSGVAFYEGKLFPRWQNKLLLGALKDEVLLLLDIQDGRVIHEESLLKNQGRVREAVVGPEGAVYVILDEPARIVRLTAEKERLL